MSEKITTPDARFSVRKYAPEDRSIVRKICADTGFLGNPIDPLFEDRELFADYLTDYYLSEEPESSFILEVEGVIRGYLLGSRKAIAQKKYDQLHIPLLAVKGLWRYFTRPYHPATKKYVQWILKNSRKEQPLTPENTPHFHINLLADARKVGTTRALIDAYLQYLAQCGEKAVFGQMITYESRRGERMFERYGFKLIDKKKVSKFDGLSGEQVYLCTVLKNLDQGVKLYD
ncbi:MAG: GNAT family acetyltransferase [Verrucomicrobiota bacterium]|nr:GNAT family acetyltransferase [Verrucomicrobiota bacterium]